MAPEGRAAERPSSGLAGCAVRGPPAPGRAPGVSGLQPPRTRFRRHEAAYLALAPECTGKTVLEAGCGEGYGADLLARIADKVIALDYDRLTAEHVRRAYPRVPPALPSTTKPACRS